MGQQQHELIQSPAKANSGTLLKGDFEQMARRRFQNPKPFREGNWWWIRTWVDVVIDGVRTRRRDRVKLAPATTSTNEVKKIAAEHMRPMNQGLLTVGGATQFQAYVDDHYKPIAVKKLAAPTYSRYAGVLKNYLLPTFGNLMLRELTPSLLDRYFCDLSDRDLAQESIDKVRDVLASVINYAMHHGFLKINPLENLAMPRARRRTARTKPYITPQQFAALVELIPEPYASMVYVSVFTGLRASELIGLRWNDVTETHITIDERCCRGDWGAPKSEASNATIPLNPDVWTRIQGLKGMTISVRAGRAVRKYTLVKSDKPDDLVFQSPRTGSPMRDNNILVRFIKPAARKLGLDFVNWQALRRSHAVWLKLAGADVKDAQAQMRHSRASTTLDIYQQFIPESQRKVVNALSGLSKSIQ